MNLNGFVWIGLQAKELTKSSQAHVRNSRTGNVT